MTHGPTLRDDDPLRLAHERPVRFDKGLLTFDQRERGDGKPRSDVKMSFFILKMKKLKMTRRIFGSY